MGGTCAVMRWHTRRRRRHRRHASYTASRKRRCPPQALVHIYLQRIQGDTRPHCASTQASRLPLGALQHSQY